MKPILYLVDKFIIHVNETNIGRRERERESRGSCISFIIENKTLDKQNNLKGKSRHSFMSENWGGGGVEKFFW